MINYNVILPTSFRKEAALRVRIDRNPILSISSKLRRPSFAMTIDRPAHPSIQPRAKKEVQKGKAAASAVSQFSLDIPSLPPSLSLSLSQIGPTWDVPPIPTALQRRKNERTRERRKAAAAGCSRSLAASVASSVVRVAHRSPIGHLRRECFISAPTAAAFRCLERDR